MSDLLLTELLSSLVGTEEGLREGLSAEDTDSSFSANHCPEEES